MDGKLLTLLLLVVLPIALIGVTIAYFGSNPLAIVGLFIVMLAGLFYLLSYTEAFVSE